MNTAITMRDATTVARLGEAYLKKKITIRVRQVSVILLRRVSGNSQKSSFHWRKCPSVQSYSLFQIILNTVPPNLGSTAPLTSKCFILYIYSTNIGTEYFKRVMYSPFFSSSKCSLFHNSTGFGFCIIHILFTGCAKINKR